MTYFAFEYFYKQTQLLDPGALMGIGLGGCIAVLGFTWQYWNGAAAVMLGLLAGCFGSGMYRYKKTASDASGTKAYQNNLNVGTYR